MKSATRALLGFLLCVVTIMGCDLDGLNDILKPGGSTDDGADSGSDTDIDSATNTDLDAGKKNGLNGVYFNDMRLSDQALERTDPKIDFNWGEESPDPKIDPHTFSVRWTGSIKSNFTETYNFTTASDDGVKLWIDNTLIINNWRDHSLTEDSGTIALEAGKLYNIKIEYYDNTADATIKLYWSSASQSKQIVPSSQLFTQYDDPPNDPIETDDVVDATTMNKKIMAGYQGWFNAEGDGAGYGWRHWSSGQPNPNNISFDIWPDLSECDPDELFETSFKYSDGSNAGLYSAYTTKTVERHVKWMQDYGIDGVCVQRFIEEAYSMRKMRDKVLTNIRSGSEKYGRVFINMYDISGGKNGTLVDDIKNDWKHLVDDIKITESDRYLRHNGKPVLAIWGFGVGDRPGSPSHLRSLAQWLKSDNNYGATLMCGVNEDWRSHGNDWMSAYQQCDIISPWSVGRYGDNSGADRFKDRIIVPDIKHCDAQSIDYMPVVFPGFSWWNLKKEKFNHHKRNGGRFLWRQFYNAVDAGSDMIYVAMYDEVDEGTAIYKLTENKDQTPTTGKFLTMDADGEAIPSDWYLRLTGEASKMLRGDISLSETIPISP